MIKLDKKHSGVFAAGVLFGTAEEGKGTTFTITLPL